MTASRNGEAFSLLTGEPVSWNRTKRATMSWYDFACAYVDMKWKAASAKHRAGIAYALTLATSAMLTDTCPYSDAEVRTALRRWAYNTKARADCPEETHQILAWVARHCEPVSALSTPTLTRALLTSATSRLDGRPAAASTSRNHRVILSNTMAYAVELKLLDANPIRDLKWKAPRTSPEVDRRSVVNPTQAHALLDAVRRQEPSGPLLMPFFALLYFAGLRPEEAVTLHESDLTLPAQEGTWGYIHLTRAAPLAGKEWTDSGKSRDSRGLKHRAEGETRLVPCVPELVEILRAHLASSSSRPDGRVLHGPGGRELSPTTIRRVWDRARRAALSEAEYSSPLAKRPYDLRHACLSTWLNAGVPAKQVAEWAGNSVKVLLSTYAKCLVGQDEIAMRRIAEALQSEVVQPLGQASYPGRATGLETRSARLQKSR
ncbi:tyrosine-type recombinase/integrase [Nonomuraea pusilla]|uniref:tyrosine-type recombinase/integrase n=1 Tax=Nonomuraea pusilla TaxID=46177 RepID=UPI00331EDA6B